MYVNVLVMHSELIEKVRIFHKWKYSHKRRSYLIKLTLNTSLFFPKNITSFFSLEIICSSFHFSLLQTTKMNLKSLQLYSNFGKTNFHRLCGFWQVSREIWTIFLDQK